MQGRRATAGSPPYMFITRFAIGSASSWIPCTCFQHCSWPLHLSGSAGPPIWPLCSCKSHDCWVKDQTDLLLPCSAEPAALCLSAPSFWAAAVPPWCNAACLSLQMFPCLLPECTIEGALISISRMARVLLPQSSVSGLAQLLQMNT